MDKIFNESIKFFEEKLKNKECFAFSKYADGEMAILKNKQIDNGEFDHSPQKTNYSFYQKELVKSFKYKHDSYYVGVGCPCCIGIDDSNWMKEFSEQNEDHLTWANVWVNSNYKYYLENIVPLYLNYEIILISNKISSLKHLPFNVKEHFKISKNSWIEDYSLIQELKNYITNNNIKNHLFLFCAGPFGNLLAYELHKHNKENTYLDVGSTLDIMLYKDIQGIDFTRCYQNDMTEYASQICVWDAKEMKEKRQPEITVILTGYNRPNNLKRQLECIQAQTIKPKEIILWYNKGSKDQIVLPGVRNITCDYNFSYFGRFCIVPMAQTEYVAVFDDDTMPGSQWFENCIKTINKFNGILGATGDRIKETLDSENITKHGWWDVSNETVEVDYVGHAWFFRTEWYKYMWMERPLTLDNGEDIHFSYCAKKYGNIKSYCPPHPKGKTELWGSIDGSLGADEVASWRTKVDFHKVRTSMIRYYINKGWDLLCFEKDNLDVNKDFKQEIDKLKNHLQNNNYFAFTSFHEEEYEILSKKQDVETNLDIDLKKSLNYNRYNFIKGIETADCSNIKIFNWYKKNCAQIEEQITFASLFKYDNFDYFKNEIINEISKYKTILIHDDSFNLNFDLGINFDRVFHVNGTPDNFRPYNKIIYDMTHQYMKRYGIENYVFLISCGTYTNSMIYSLHNYNKNNFYININSLNNYIHNDNKICLWNNVKTRNVNFCHNVFNRIENIYKQNKINKYHFPNNHTSISYNCNYHLNININTEKENISTVYFGNNYGHQIGALNGMLTAMNDGIKYPSDYIIFSHDDVIINDIDLLNNWISILEKTNYKLIIRRPNWVKDENYFMFESFIIKYKEAKEIFNNIKLLDNIEQLPLDHQNHYCSEKYFGNLILEKLTYDKIKIIDFHHDSYGDSELGFYHCPPDNKEYIHWDKKNYKELFL